MQDIDSYEQGVHTAGQAFGKVLNIADDIQRRYTERSLNTLRSALVLILSYVAGNLLIKTVEGEENIWIQILYVFGFIGSLVLLDLFQECCIQYNTEMSGARYYHRVKNSYAHAFHQ